MDEIRLIIYCFRKPVQMERRETRFDPDGRGQFKLLKGVFIEY